MIDTADSSVSRIIWTSNKIGKNKINNFGPIFPNNVNNRCPAIIFAVNRIVRVIGRIILLIDSINTINGIKIFGVPCGTKCVNIWLVILIHPNNINLIHSGRAIIKLIDRWLVLVKIYGNNPKKLFIKIKINREINNKLKLLLFFLIIILNSLNKLFKIFEYIRFKLFGINQNKFGIRKINKNIDIQFKEKFKIIFVDGSNIENKFIIIFNLIFFYLFFYFYFQY